MSEGNRKKRTKVSKQHEVFGRVVYSEFVPRPRRQTVLLVLGFCLAIAATFFFGYRAGRVARHIRRQGDTLQSEPIKPWMSVPYIAHTHRIREDLLFQAIRVPPNPRDHRPIRDIARAENIPVADLMRDLRNAVLQAQHAPGRAP